MSTETQNFKGVGTPATRLYGLLAIVALGWVLLGGLIFTPEDVVQGARVRIMYVHVPTAWVAYLAFIVTGVASACWMIGKKHSIGFDRVAGASAEVGVLFMAMTLFSGSLWGRISWGTYWVWDPRLTTTAFLFVTYIGYLAVRGLGGTAQQRARRSSVIALLAVLEIPLVHFSVVMWSSLHQRATVLSPDGDIKMDDLMLFTLLCGVFGFSVLFAWLVSHRQRIMAMKDVQQTTAIDVAVTERLKEAQV